MRDNVDIFSDTNVIYAPHKAVINPLMDFLLRMCVIDGSYQQRAGRNSNDQQSIYLSVYTIYSIL